ncbi:MULTISPECIES: transposase [Photorhabdus]|uniref:Insertion element IS402-like domain-containing protein n=1 Tax=Photorhabdus thracensis TaxID=230089 RepID=A0A0F7LUM1_9GAMM|nr:transposase [Photorhabdus thracensis]AKH65561.1 hypothetical protein VY86_21525 [Photorhabdus thracensis]
MANNKWRLSDELWGKMAPLIPEHKTQHPLGTHRKRVDNRAAMDAIFFVLRTGCQWNALNATGICSSSSAHRRFQEWRDAGVFERFWQNGLLACKHLAIIDKVGTTSCTSSLARKSQNTDFKAQRWVVERTHIWMNRFRRILTRWEKKVENYETMLHFACGIIVWNKTLLG